MKTHPLRAEFFHVYRQTDGLKDRYDEANSRFSKFCELV
jgi:hypothetical protein